MDFSNRFADKEKIAAFDKISGLYFDRNFGSFSKADFETLMFSIYIGPFINWFLAVQKMFYAEFLKVFPLGKLVLSQLKKY